VLKVYAEKLARLIARRRLTIQTYRNNARSAAPIKLDTTAATIGPVLAFPAGAAEPPTGIGLDVDEGSVDGLSVAVWLTLGRVAVSVVSAIEFVNKDI